MEKYLQINKQNCKNCYKCIRHCPVKSIKFSNNQASTIVDECILCGACYVVCPQNAKSIRNDVSSVKQLLAENEQVAVSLAPSFIANYSEYGYESVKNAIKKLGFSIVEETAVGAEIVKKQYEFMVANRQKNVIISTCCHSINMLITKYYPSIIGCMADVMSPMQTHCTMLKKQYDGIKTVFIGPCIAKKEEAEMYNGIVDAVLTFNELTDWLKEENIEFEQADDESQKFRSRFFPAKGGIIRSMDTSDTDFNYIAIDGVDNCIEAIDDIINGNIDNCFIEMSACVGSCIEGPAMDNKKRSPIGGFIAVNQFSGDSDLGVCGLDEASLAKDMDFIGARHQLPGNSTIDEILLKMGKSTKDDELNCGSCGYNTCRDKAVAVFMGKADFTMCLPFLKEKAESFSDKIIGNTPNGIMVLNEDLVIQQINKSACDIFDVANGKDMMGQTVDRLLNPSDYVNVLNSGENLYNNKIYLSQLNKYIDETIIYDSNYRIIISFMRDITEKVIRHNQKDMVAQNTIEITDKVIEKHMRTVQEIASLLGETAAETKIALTNLKEFLTYD